MMGKAEPLIAAEDIYPAKGAAEKASGSILPIEGEAGTDHHQVQCKDPEIGAAGHGVMAYHMGSLFLEKGVEEEGLLHVLAAVFIEPGDKNTPVRVFVPDKGPVYATHDTDGKGKCENEMDETHPSHNVLGRVMSECLSPANIDACHGQSQDGEEVNPMDYPDWPFPDISDFKLFHGQPPTTP
jgi:hypothetical protein